MAVITVIARDVAVYSFFGVARSAAKGYGPIFHQIRNYHYGRVCRVERAHVGSGLGEAKVQRGARHLETGMLGGLETRAAAVGGGAKKTQTLEPCLDGP